MEKKTAIEKQLIEARTKLQDQIDLVAGPQLIGTGGRSDLESLEQLLRARLKEINDELARIHRQRTTGK